MSYQAQYERWLHSPALSQPEKDELAALSHNAGEIEDRFFSLLQFGTAGLRGVMGVGLRRMNVHVIRHATRPLPTSSWPRAKHLLPKALPSATTAGSTPRSSPVPPPK